MINKFFHEILNSLIFLGLIAFVGSCTYDKIDPNYESLGYPQEVGNIIVNKCATSGCHNDKSKDAVGGLSLESWDKLFEGSRGGAVVIPYRSDFSTLIYYTNTYDEFGSIELSPTMPFNESKLTKEEVQILYDWVKEGAPSANGLVKFSDDPNRKKFYVANQGCDVVTVFDAKTMLAMRYVDVGESASIEGPHMVKVAPNNQFWCASYIGGAYFQKYSVADNSFLGQVFLGAGSWNTFVFSSNSQTAYVINWSGVGGIAVVDLINMTVTHMNGFAYPHGSALNNTEDTLYVTSQIGNYIYKIPVNDFGSYEQISLNGSTPTNTSSLDPHEILFSPDGSKYFVSCQRSNEIRVMQTSTDNLLAVLPVGEYPQEMAVSKTTPYLFVSCMEDTTSNATERGSISIINYQTLSVIKSVYAGYQPHGVAADDLNKRVYVANRNIASSGPAPHHSSACVGRNGYVTAIDMNTLEVIPGFRTEVSVDPYAIGITH